MKQLNRIILIICLVIVLVPALSIAQPPPPPPDPVDTPIDGGLTAMLAIGAGYGFKKIYDRNKKNKEQKLGEK